jgi:hypothetical protein
MADPRARTRNKIEAGHLPAYDTPFLPVRAAEPHSHRTVVCGLCDKVLNVDERWFRLFPHGAGVGTIELHEECYRAWKQEASRSP